MEYVPLAIATVKGIQALAIMAREFGHSEDDMNGFLKKVNFVCERLEMARATRIRLRNKLLISEQDSSDACPPSRSASITRRQLQEVLHTESTAWDAVVEVDNRILGALAKRFDGGHLPGCTKKKRGRRNVLKMKIEWRFGLQKEAEKAAPGLESCGMLLSKLLKSDIWMEIMSGEVMRKEMDMEERLGPMGVAGALDEAARMLGETGDEGELSGSQDGDEDEDEDEDEGAQDVEN